MKKSKCFCYILLVVLFLGILCLFSFFYENLGIIVRILIVWGITVLFCCLRNSKTKMSFFIVNFVLFYSLMVMSLFLYGELLEYNLDKFDLNGDGIFSEEENTSEKEIAMAKVIGDGGRNLLVYFGIFISFLSSCGLIVVKIIYVFIKGVIGYLQKRIF